MIRIGDTTSRILADINNIHHAAVKPGILARLRSSYNSKTISKCQHDFIYENIDLILKGLPRELETVSKSYKLYCNARRCKNIKKGLAHIFGYSSFKTKHKTNYCAYSLAANLDVRICPYCNRQYTFTVITSTAYLSRPEFDHFLSQSDYPLLSMSFYNLVPSCKICNSTLKHAKKFSLDTHIHPYIQGFEGLVKFNYHPYDASSAIGLANNVEVRMDVDEDHVDVLKFKKNIQVFKLKEIYQGHTDVIAEVVRKFYMSNGRYLETIIRSFPQIGSYEELYRLAFGNYFSNDDLDKRVLAKLTKDVVHGLDFTLPIKF